MTTVRDLLRHKGNTLWSITPEATVYDALTLMAEKNIGALLVFDAQQNLAGIISERDYARKVVLKGKTSRETLVSEIMTTKVFGVQLDQSNEECMALMTAKHIRHLPVLENNSQVVGMISIGDVVRAVIADQQFKIEQLENYIMGHR